MKTVHISYFCLVIILVVLSALVTKSALLPPSANTVTDLYISASAIGTSLCLFVYGLVLLILGMVKHRGIPYFLGISVSLLFITGLGAANYILFLLFLGFTGSG